VFLFVQEEKRATETSKMDVVSQKDKTSSKTDVAAMAASLKVSFLHWLLPEFLFLQRKCDAVIFYVILW